MTRVANDDSPMPRESPFRIVLSAEEVGEWHRRSGKYTFPYFEVVRAKMILMAASGGGGNDEIAQRLGDPARGVSH